MGAADTPDHALASGPAETDAVVATAPQVGGSKDAVDGSTLRLLVPGQGPLLVPLPFEADPSCITAKFSKKRGKLDVKVVGVTK